MVWKLIIPSSKLVNKECVYGGSHIQFGGGVPLRRYTHARAIGGFDPMAELKLIQTIQTIQILDSLRDILLMRCGL